jgi:hypothetical protein
MAAVHNSEDAERETVARRYAPEVRLLLIAGLVVVDELADELYGYQTSPDKYEEVYSNPKSWVVILEASTPRFLIGEP